MKFKPGKAAIIAVLALVFIMQLVFWDNKKSDSNIENPVAEATNQSEAAELNVVYRSTVSATDSEDSDIITETAATSSAFSDKIVSYTLEELPIYEQPDIASTKVGIMYSGSEGTIVEEGEEWTEITSGSVTGYVRNVDVLFGAEAEVVASTIGTKKATVLDAEIPVYASADENSGTISSLAQGAEVNAYETTGEYTLISCDNGFGYIKTASMEMSYGLDTAKSMEEIEAIEAEERAEAAKAAAAQAASQAAAAQAAASAAAVAQSTTSRDAYSASTDQTHLLAAIIYWESGWEPTDGQLAVANVVLNRVSSPAFSQNTIESVIYAPGQFTGVAENGAPTARFQAVLNMSNEELNVRGCYDVALRALAGENNIGDMLFFISVRKANFARYTEYTIINNHCFYNY